MSLEALPTVSVTPEYKQSGIHHHSWQYMHELSWEELSAYSFENQYDIEQVLKKRPGSISKQQCAYLAYVVQHGPPNVYQKATDKYFQVMRANGMWKDGTFCCTLPSIIIPIIF